MKSLLALISVSVLISACGGGVEPFVSERDKVPFDEELFITDQNMALCTGNDEEVIYTPIKDTNDYFVTYCACDGLNDEPDYCADIVGGGL